MPRFRAYFLCLLFVLPIALGAAPAQPAGPRAGSPKAAAQEKVRPILKALSITDEELGRIDAILAKDEANLGKDRAEIRILQAQVTRLLLDDNPNMDSVQAAVKKSLDLEFAVRMIQINRQIELKKILGTERWSKILKLARMAVEAERSGKLKERFDTRDLSEAERRIWTRLLDYSGRFLP